MCGRFALTSDAASISKHFRVNLSSPILPRFNIAPSQKVLGIRLQSKAHEYTSALLSWGLIPSWAHDQSIGAKLTNARSETALTKPSFRDSFRQRRCLIPADGFYEWTASKNGKQPYYIRLASHQPFGIAGLWDSWGSDGERIETCTILTCDANEAMKHLHPRMPVVIKPERYDAWLDPATPVSELSQDLFPFSTKTTVISPVSDYVNNVRHDDVRCQQEYLDPNQAGGRRNIEIHTANQKLLFDK